MRAIIKCSLCHRPRCIYSRTKLTPAVEAFLASLEEEQDYCCGGSLVDENDHIRHSVVVRRQLNCRSQIEVPYYASKVVLPQVCIHCGSTSGGTLLVGDVIEELKRKHTTVSLVACLIALDRAII